MTSDLEQAAQVAPDRRGVHAVSTSVVRRGWGEPVFGIVAEGHVRRRPSDIVRVIVAAVVVALAAAGVTDLTRIEAAAFDLFASLPDGLEPVWSVLYLLAPIAAGALLVTALVARQPRLLATQAVAVGVAGIAGAALSAAVAHRRRHRPRARSRTHCVCSASTQPACASPPTRRGVVPPTWLRKKDYV